MAQERMTKIAWLEDEISMYARVIQERNARIAELEEALTIQTKVVLDLMNELNRGQR